MYDFPTLYKNGKQQWNCQVENLGDHSIIIVSHGQIGGKIQTKETVIMEGKNIGKSNETTHYEQAISEAESKWKKQKDKLYLEAGEESTTFDVRPMLAQSYDKHGHKITFPCYGQPKLDGIRCLATKDGLYSRQGKKFAALQHIENALSSIFTSHPTLVLDGELYSHEIDFQSIISGTKRDESNELTAKIEYHIYDCVDRSNPFSVRINGLRIKLMYEPEPLVYVDTFMVHTKEAVAEIHNEVVNEGYEGIMLRNAHGMYTPDKRSYDLQKVKAFQDAEFKITAITEDKNGHAVFTCVTQGGTEFDVKPQGDDASRKAYLSQDVIGKMLTVKFFDYTTSENPVPRFPIGVAIRDYEN